MQELGEKGVLVTTDRVDALTGAIPLREVREEKVNTARTRIPRKKYELKISRRAQLSFAISTKEGRQEKPYVPSGGGCQ